MKIATDTATCCLFDLSCLSHRKDDVGDWWSIPENELQEVNGGNAIILNLGDDGDYSVIISDQSRATGREYQLKIPSGRFYIGPGEELTGGGFEPDGSWGGAFVTVDPGNYIFTIDRYENNIEVFYRKGGNGSNNLTDLIRL